MPRSGEQVLSEPRTWEEVLENDGIPAELKPTYLKFVLTEWERATRYHKNPLFAAMEDPFGPAHASYCAQQNERMEQINQGMKATPRGPFVLADIVERAAAEGREMPALFYPGVILDGRLNPLLWVELAEPALESLRKTIVSRLC